MIKKANFFAAQNKENLAQSDAVTVLTDEEILNCMGIYHMCKLKEAKRMMAKYGGTAHTEWYDRDGSFQDSMDISLDRANKGSYRSA